MSASGDHQLGVTPRSYQYEVLDKAIDSNVIAVLDTGSGKTLISVMLISHMARLEQKRRTENPGLRTRLSVFLVPLVPLVLQQEEYVRKHCNLKVKHYYGAMRVDDWSEERWKNEVSEAEVMVMTADIFRNMLCRAYIAMEQINLIIFDECHHARKNHAYNQIMGIHYKQCRESGRPKIFGMTASPTFGKESYQSSIMQIEGNLDARAVTVDVAEVSPHVPRPKQTVVYYKGTERADPPALYYLVKQYGGPAEEELAAALKKSLILCEELGTWCAARALEMAVLATDARLKRSRVLQWHNGRPTEECSEPKELEKVAAFANLKSYVMTSPFWFDNLSSPTANDLSPKVMTLLKVLEEYRNCKHFCGIVFVQRRATARVLDLVIKRWKGLEFVKSDILVGHGIGSASPADVNLRVQQQRKIVQSFQKGETNLIIATRVAEEGLDIRACNLVIRFDVCITLTNYIQSRGRARRMDSEFITLCNRNSPSEAVQLAELQREEQLMRAALQTRESLTGSMESAVQPSDEEIYTVESTGASVTLYTSIGMLYNYCALLPTDSVGALTPTFQIAPVPDLAYGPCEFKASVTLPPSVPIEARYATSKLCARKALAKQWAALEIIKRLHAAGELDDRLKPIKAVSQIAGFDEMVEPVGTGGDTERKKRQILEFRMKTPVFWRGSWKPHQPTWLTLVRMHVDNGNKPTSDIGLLTVGEGPMQKGIFHMSIANRLTAVEIQSSRCPLDLDLPTLASVKRFHVALFKGILRSDVQDEAEWATIVVPVVETLTDWTALGDAFDPRAVIDWESVAFASRAQQPLLDQDGNLTCANLQAVVLHSRVHHNRLYLVDKVHDHLTPYSDWPIEEGKFPTLGRYYEARLKYPEPIHTAQPIIKAHRLPYITQTTMEKQPTSAAYLIPQCCTIYPIPAHIMRGTALHLPILLQHLQHRLLASDLKYYGFDDFMSDDYLHGSVEDLQAALTAPVADPTVNYERLETFGDSFLKIHQSLHLYASYPTCHEGRLSLMRNALERNTALRACAMKLGLEGYVLGTGLSRREWTPPEQLGGGGSVHKLSDKTVADVVEAIIGACLCGGGIRGGAGAVVKLLGHGYESDWSIYSQKLAESRQSRTFTVMEPIVRQVEQAIGYQFKDMTLAIEALVHASEARAVAEIGSYQRLEFLGDAALGFVVTRHLYAISPPLSPAELSEFRSELVNNQFLSWVSWTLGLTKHIQYNDAALESAIAHFGHQMERVTGGVRTPRFKTSALKGPLYWKELDAAPKSTGDVYEAILGAVFVDSGFDVEAPWGVVLRTLIDPWWHLFQEAGCGTAQSKCVRSADETNPIGEAYEWTQKMRCERLQFTIEIDEEAGVIRCTCTFHDVPIGCGEGKNKKIAKRIAAEHALTFLRSIDRCACHQEGKN
ncbi:uncharacterized protein SPPG_03994 [Spizellomyces punctatus DAOM BR117]|uniref:Dicer-like protein 1 n=1 Tax=Spizellomyces punctatus (strain DAOM BR117) TaxID=645134 RepID=A0A0L0HJ80_SPIPD|nr:uncharacterized protein SPPG_03994 [Spizellomyces punctatus DAOM BR117]KND00894.1 hypothetical protein SPPG_03994 [Spizellomyces punctatus DAOM BR117]|eukprot:XP_016608933.1 hypothetical protein SPPG_03994 [Spizellomyces punctatus DAOM BR117]